MFAPADDLRRRLQDLVDDLDPDCFDGPGAVRMLDVFTRLENLASYGKTVMARRVEYTDHAAFVRGHTEPGEICEIEGVGPVPVATARNLSTDALIYVLATKGTEITHYAEHGRYIPKALRLAV